MIVLHRLQAAHVRFSVRGDSGADIERHRHCARHKAVDPDLPGAELCRENLS